MLEKLRVFAGRRGGKAAARALHIDVAGRRPEDVIEALVPDPNLDYRTPAGYHTTEAERAAVTYWSFHNRECRRWLQANGRGPTDPRHLAGCRCGGPAAAYDRAVALMLQAGA